MTTDYERPARVGDWMQTYTGRQFWPVDPRPDDVHIDDIAHALSMVCRYGGHVLDFYSVAEHCCHLHDEAAPEHKAWALLHDASEAYIADIIRPLKPSLKGYLDHERVVMWAICIRFGLKQEMPPEVKTLDNRILADEAAQAMSAPPAPWAYNGEPLGIKLGFWPPYMAKREFLARFKALNLGVRI